MANVQKHNICVNVPSSQTSRSYISHRCFAIHGTADSIIYCAGNIGTLGAGLCHVCVCVCVCVCVRVYVCRHLGAGLCHVCVCRHLGAGLCHVYVCGCLIFQFLNQLTNFTQLGMNFMCLGATPVLLQFILSCSY
jgi:hypothetical protein